MQYRLQYFALLCESALCVLQLYELCAVYKRVYFNCIYHIYIV